MAALLLPLTGVLPVVIAVNANRKIL